MSINLYNHEGYLDPTAYKAINNLEKETNNTNLFFEEIESIEEEL